MRAVSRICADLVKIHSENPPGRTDEVIEYIRSFLYGIGIDSSVTGNAEGMCNLVTIRSGKPRQLLFCGHVDVVPALDAGWTHPPFSGIIDNEFVHGRGSTDMKGGCASILAACEALVNRNEEVPATLAFVCDEETGGENGIRRLLANHALTPGDCLVAEPTPSRHPCIGQKGLCRLDMEFSGTPAHGSLYPAVGTSAIMEVMTLLTYVKELNRKEYPVDPPLHGIIEGSSSVLGQEFGIAGVRDVLRRLTFNPGVIRGGEKANVVAQHCALELELRVPWGCSIPSLISSIEAHAPCGKIVTQETHNPSITEPSSPLVAITCDAVKQVYGGEVFPIVQWAASDARHLRAAGFKVIEYGPGEIPSLHAVNERTPVDSLEKASLVYLAIMAKYA
ncbi:MAG: M20/M25/M40 family metallo-hydrolase [Methanoregula sp.]|nr:M20/M25/M40 family metallo-hydrolase [Methanoregula sp.]